MLYSKGIEVKPDDATLHRCVRPTHSAVVRDDGTDKQRAGEIMTWVWFVTSLRIDRQGRSDSLAQSQKDVLPLEKKSCCGLFILTVELSRLTTVTS